MKLEEIISYDTAVKLVRGDIDILDYEDAQDLYDYYVETGQMPTPIAKARTGDPWEWIINELSIDLPMLIE